jgi:hypothetical protein
MPLGRIAVVGDGGLLGEIIEMELARYGELIVLPEHDALIHASDPAPAVIAVWAEATDIGGIREQLRQSLPAQANPLLVFLSQLDPYVYFTRLRELHVERRRLSFDEMFNEIAGQVTAGSTTTAPLRAGSV